MIYLDNSATTPLDARVLEAMMPWLTTEFGNPSSIHFVGRKARVEIEDARSEIADAIGAHPAEILFTSGGTESNNTVLLSALVYSKLATGAFCSAVEHHSVLDVVARLKEQGAKADVLPVDENGGVILHDDSRVSKAGTLVSVMHVNNETGYLQDMHSVRAAVPDSLLHTDAVQSLGKVDLNVGRFGVDFATMSAHKIGGPKGVGALFVRKGIDFKPIQIGGSQERNRRAGTENVAGIVGFRHAVRYAMTEFSETTNRIASLRQELLTLISQEIPYARINTRIAQSAPHILNISFPNADMIHGESLLQLLDIKGLAVSNGSACVSGSQQASHVLLAMGLSKKEAATAIRISLGSTTTKKDIHGAVTILSEVTRSMCV